MDRLLGDLQSKISARAQHETTFEIEGFVQIFCLCWAKLCLVALAHDRQSLGTEASIVRTNNLTSSHNGA